MFSREWRCSWSSADRRCSNYIGVIDNFIAYWGASYIRDFTVVRTYGAPYDVTVIIWHGTNLGLFYSTARGAQYAVQFSNTSREWIIVKYHNSICFSFYYVCWNELSTDLRVSVRPLSFTNYPICIMLIVKIWWHQTSYLPIVRDIPLWSLLWRHRCCCWDIVMSS